mgnify:CR=1 FL=1
MAADIVRELWHKRLCHTSRKEMRKLAQGNLIPEVKNVQLEKCTDCLAGKHIFFVKAPDAEENAIGTCANR